MSRALDIVAFLSASQGHLTIDVRSPKEFNKGHIPHAVNLPLFNDEERAKVGTLYKQTGRSEAIEAGLEIVGPKMADFVRHVKPLVKDNKIFVHCWRGGMRSGSMAWLFDTMGYETYTLHGGYKSYRNLVIDELSSPAKYIIIGGRTGSGKTELLHQLHAQGQQIIDLERIAHHKGSAFGHLGEKPQPSPEQFENNLYLEFAKLSKDQPIWLEDESKNIGKCYIPNGLWGHMCASPVIVIETPLKPRIERLIKEYAVQDIVGLKESIEKLERRLGNEGMKDALKALDDRSFAEVARITLRYYDKAYDHGMKMRPSKDVTIINVEGMQSNEVIDSILARIR